MIRLTWAGMRVVGLVVIATVLAPVVIIFAVDRAVRYLADR